MRHNPPKKKSAGCRQTAAAFAVLCLVLVVAGAAGAAGAAEEQGTSTASITVILVRHAEASDDDPRNPHLSAEGLERAAELARVLQDLDATHLFASEYNRTQQTLAPMAASAGLVVMERSARQPDGLIEELRALPDGAVAIVAGHSNTVPDLVRRLGGNPRGLEEHPKHGWLLPHDEYGRMFVVTLQRPLPSAPLETNHGPGDVSTQRTVGSVPATFVSCLELRFGAP